MLQVASLFDTFASLLLAFFELNTLRKRRHQSGARSEAMCTQSGAKLLSYCLELSSRVAQSYLHLIIFSFFSYLQLSSDYLHFG